MFVIGLYRLYSVDRTLDWDILSK